RGTRRDGSDPRSSPASTTTGSCTGSGRSSVRRSPGFPTGTFSPRRKTACPRRRSRRGPEPLQARRERYQDRGIFRRECFACLRVHLVGGRLEDVVLGRGFASCTSGGGFRELGAERTGDRVLGRIRAFHGAEACLGHGDRA